MALRVGNTSGPELGNTFGPELRNTFGPTLGNTYGPGWGILLAFDIQDRKGINVEQVPGKFFYFYGEFDFYIFLILWEICPLWALASCYSNV